MKISEKKKRRRYKPKGERTFTIGALSWIITVIFLMIFSTFVPLIAESLVYLYFIEFSISTGVTIYGILLIVLAIALLVMTVILLLMKSRYCYLTSILTGLLLGILFYAGNTLIIHVNINGL